MVIVRPRKEFRAVGMGHALDGSWAHPQYKPLRLRLDPELPMALENGHDFSKERGQTLGVKVATCILHRTRGSLYTFGCTSGDIRPVQVERTATTP
ncbi:hypothetical protein [Candidatus Hadarchaeum sp.]|uniref:hypothetical protein n=1 Tax=Candidatus Hadarchaeum sp. TaxID=2883567 RepID=UPI0031784E47